MSNNNHTPVKNKTIDVPMKTISPSEIRLSEAQNKQINKLAAAIDQAQLSLEAAQKTRDSAQQNANDFLIYCAEELGVMPLNEWTFDNATRSFQRVVMNGGENADFSGTE